MHDAAVHILTGLVQSGKTTSLLQWLQKTSNVYGILSPVVNGVRVFMNVETKEQFAMEAALDESPIISVGKFSFSKSGFDKAVTTVRAAIPIPGWLVIDEIGPLELRGEGFHDVLKEALSLRTGNILLVVREGLVQQVQDYFTINAVVLKNINEL